MKAYILLCLFVLVAALTVQFLKIGPLLFWGFLPLDSDYELQWNWDQIDTNDIHFPENFIFGTATAAHQVEGNCTNNDWHEFENRIPSPIKNNEKSGIATDHWNLYKQDIDLMKDELHVQSYRFSIEWSKIEPREGVFDDVAIKHYHDKIDYMLKRGIEPVVTLHHFTSPIWFTHKGGFEKLENIPYFVRFSERMFNEYHKKVRQWCTINEPIVVTLIGYIVGVFPPGKKDPMLAGYVLQHLIQSHAMVYRSFKKMIAERNLEHENHKIGIVFNIVQFDPVKRFNILDRAVSQLMESLYTDSILNYLKHGVYRFRTPGVDIYEENDYVKDSLDFVGLNYYYYLHIKFKMHFGEPIEFVNKTEEFNEEFTDMGWNIYPEGIYRAIKRLSKLNVPIYITENGIADHKDDRREKFIKRYMYAISKAMKEGYDIRGYFYWSFCDNFEWAEGFHPRFGLYHVDYKTQKRTLREGSKYFVDVVKKFTSKKAN